MNDNYNDRHDEQRKQRQHELRRLSQKNVSAGDEKNHEEISQEQSDDASR